MGMGSSSSSMNGTMGMVRRSPSAVLIVRYSIQASWIRFSHWHGRRRPPSRISEHGCSRFSSLASLGHYSPGRPYLKDTGFASSLRRPSS